MSDAKLKDRDMFSRKFMVTVGAMGLTTLLAFYGKFDANVALVFGAAIAAYNYANMKVTMNGNGSAK